MLSNKVLLAKYKVRSCTQLCCQCSTFFIRWVKGYNGKTARYIDKNTLVYECGNNINFMKETGESSVFTSPGEGVTALDVHPLNKVFAFAELCIKPRLFVYKYPEMECVSEIKGKLIVNWY